ncbi:signal peptide-containing protein [Cryptosporidium canis]|nr:signal peptide-containing protein [Cryptosporidium canis]
MGVRISNAESSHKARYIRKCAFIIVLATSLFVVLVTVNLLTVLYGSVPWTEPNTWTNYPLKEYSLPQMIKKLKPTSSIDQVKLTSPFLNGTFTKMNRMKYGYPIFEHEQMESNCKHLINYDVTIPPGGWIIYSSCHKSFEDPNGYNSIRAIGYTAYGKAQHNLAPVDVKEWYHAIHNHIRVPISVS